jgi:ketosteroid isomerase-like protein
MRSMAGSFSETESSAQAIDPLAVLRAIEARWNAAAAPLNPVAIAAVYSQRALFFGGLPDHYVGRAEVERYFQHYVGMLTSINLTIRDVFICDAPEGMVLIQGFADFSFGLPDGRTTHASLRATLGMIREDGDWKISLHHFSPPPEWLPVPL